jgi:uncharacterized RDD family membrane protein YckC
MFRVQTPEGVDIALHAAGPLARLCAWMIDFCIRGGVTLAVGVPLLMLGEFGSGLFMILFFALEWSYPVLFEVLRQGKTPGKSVLGLRVIKEDATPVDWNAATVRNLLRAADVLPFFGFGLIAMLATRGFRRLGDLAAGTLVVYDSGLAEAFALRASGHKKHTPVPPRLALDYEEQHALMSFAARAPLLGRERAHELASVVAAALHDRPGDPVASVSAVAAWVSGERPA